MILHIASLSTKHIMFPYVEFINENFNRENHSFLFCSNTEKQISYDNANVRDIFKESEYFLSNMEKAEKIILHGIWYDKLCEILLSNPNFFEKTYWIMWGGDFYFPEKQSLIKKQAIRRMKYLVTYIKSDYELAKKCYETSGVYHECFMYPSNLYKECNIKQKEHETINIQVGNSADPSNNHIEVFEKINIYKDENINVYVPLSYGDKEYAKEVIIQGKEIFGNKLIPMMDFIPFEKHLEFLGNIDIAIFAHKRQQAMGNIITLLGLGKKVYMNSNITPWQFFHDKGIKVFDVKNIELEALNDNKRKKNQQIIKEYFSKENYINQLRKLFNYK